MDIQALTAEIVAFRDERDWKQFHSPDHLATAISIEASELQEHFLWKSPDEVKALISESGKKAAIGEEIADILNFTLLLAHELQLDPSILIRDKMKKNAIKYPVEKSRGNSSKYTEL